EEITKKKIDVLLISSQNETTMLRVCQQVYLLRPRTIPIVIAESYSPEMLHKVMQTGVHNILPLALSSEKMQAQIEFIVQNEKSRLSALETSNNQNRMSKVITVFSSKGGIGKTTFAANLAVSLAQTGQKVALLDFDLEFGDIDTVLRIKSEETISDLIQEMSVATVDTIRKYMTVHSSGVNVLAAPNSPEYADNLSSGQVDKIISTLRNHYDYLIIDTTSSFKEINLTCFDASSEVMYLTSTDISSISRTKKGLIILESLIGREKIKLIVSDQKPSRINVKNISSALDYQVWKTIPHDEKLIVESINLGKPYVLSDPHSGLAKAVNGITGELAKIKKEENKKQGSLLDKLFTKKAKPSAKTKKVKKRRR
ncbi:MAG TPA: P-loop NTPase, partial [Erysipelothrix sp.]